MEVPGWLGEERKRKRTASRRKSATFYLSTSGHCGMVAGKISDCETCSFQEDRGNPGPYSDLSGPLPSFLKRIWFEEKTEHWSKEGFIGRYWRRGEKIRKGKNKLLKRKCKLLRRWKEFWNSGQHLSRKSMSQEGTCRWHVHAGTKYIGSGSICASILCCKLVYRGFSPTWPTWSFLLR